jgi:hypothetical protein
LTRDDDDEQEQATATTFRDTSSSFFLLSKANCFNRLKNTSKKPQFCPYQPHSNRPAAPAKGTDSMADLPPDVRRELQQSDQFVPPH